MNYASHGQFQRPNGGAMIGPYRLGSDEAGGEIATSRWTTVRLGIHSGDPTLTPVAIKQLRPQVASDPNFSEPFYDEAQVAMHLQHECVLSAIDLVGTSQQCALVFPYIHGESFSKAVGAAYRQGQPAHPAIVRRIVTDILEGLHAVHTATDQNGRWLEFVHRSVSPHNILVGVDGISRVHDFGVTQALGRPDIANYETLRGPSAYLAPEQIDSPWVDHRADIFSTGVLLWEALTCRRLFQADSEAKTVACVQRLHIAPPSHYRAGISPELDAVVMAALARDPARRFQSAWDMYHALAASGPSASRAEVGQWVHAMAQKKLYTRAWGVDLLRAHMQGEYSA